MRLGLFSGMKVSYVHPLTALPLTWLGIDITHNPEFSTCEFYQAYASLEDLIRMTEDLIKQLVSNQKYFSVPPSLENSTFQFKRVDFLPTLENQIKAQIPSFKMPNLSSTEALPELVSVVSEVGIEVESSDGKHSLPHILDVLGSHFVEPLCKEPTFIIGYPTVMSPLAKSFIDPITNQELSARAELFIGGVEYVNLYEEENDPYQQTKKFLQQTLDSRDRESKEDISLDVPYDQLFSQLSPAQKYYVRVLEMGLPPTGGWGCGMERLTMLLGGTDRIGDVLPFGTLRNVIAMGT
jgi:lysyl-tRNA synthetase, class II